MSATKKLPQQCVFSYCAVLHVIIFALSMLIVSGCAYKATTGQESAVHVQERNLWESARDIAQVESAFVNKDKLWITYLAINGEQAYAYAGLEMRGNQSLYISDKTRPVRILVPVAREALEAAQTDSEPVEAYVPKEWQALLQTALHDLTPAEEGVGAVVDILNEDEICLYRTHDDTLVAVPIIYKPSDVQVQKTYTFSDLLQVIHERLVMEYPDSESMLFETGDERQFGSPFVYARKNFSEILFLQYISDAEDTESRLLGTSLEVLTHTLADHVRALFNQPVSSVSSLFTMVSTTTADLAHPTPITMLGQKQLPPLYQGEGMDLMEWEAELDQITGDETSAGHLTYRVDGTEFFPRLFDLVGSAENSVYLRVYIFDNDDYAQKIADLLKLRSHDIDIRVLVDGLGTRGAKMKTPPSAPPGYVPEPSIIEYLKQNSRVRVRTVPNVWLTGDHTKTILIDGKTAFLGGMNIGREYRYDWHDMMVEVEGSVVSEIVHEFNRAWISSALLGDLRRFFGKEKPGRVSGSEAEYPVRLLYTRPGDSGILRAQIAATRHARRMILLENPYITSDAMLYELIKARRRGVDVRVIMPYRTDSGLITRSNVLAANAMLRNGIRVFIYPQMSHLKAAIYDGWACLGSANMDKLSLRTNREMNLATSHAPAVEDLYERVFIPDMQHSVELTRPLPSNWSDYLAELLADTL